MCWYHVTFHLNLELEHTLDFGSSGDHRVHVWWRSNLPARRSDFRDSTKVPISHDPDLEHILDAGFPGDHLVQVWSQSGHLPTRRSDLHKSLQTDGWQTPLHCISSLEWAKNSSLHMEHAESFGCYRDIVTSHHNFTSRHTHYIMNDDKWQQNTNAQFYCHTSKHAKKLQTRLISCNCQEN